MPFSLRRGTVSAVLERHVGLVRLEVEIIVAAVTQAAMRRWNKPILFHRVRGTTLPVTVTIRETTGSP